eukprot:Skav233250  [mRNA]  locus=scaffold2371:23196:23696:- [translate_table: standard]
MRNLIGGELEKSVEASNVFSPPVRVETELLSSKQPAKDIGSCALNVPADQVPPACEEISLAGETHGGRLEHETPEGLSSRLQIDQLTDDGEETDFRKDVAECDDEDLVEVFALDPDFDYDNTELSSRVAENHLGDMLRSLASSSHGMREARKQEEDEVLEDAVVEK